MGELRVRRIRFAALLLATAAAAAVLAPLSRPRHHIGSLEADQRVAHRFEHYRGLTPCSFENTEVVASARNALRTAGVADPALIAVVAPTFSGVRVVAFDASEITVVPFSGEAGFTRPGQWFSRPVEPKRTIPLSPQSYTVLTAPIRRHVLHPMTVARSGLDGTVYILDWGGECASTWSPSAKDGPSGLIGEMLDELQAPAPSLSKLLELAQAVDRADLGAGG